MESNEVAFFHTKVGEIVGLERGKMFNNEYLNDYYKVIMVLILLHEIWTYHAPEMRTFEISLVTKLYSKCFVVS